MKSPKAVIVVTEGVSAGMLGPYGSATATTPALDRLAAESLVLDQCLLDSFELPVQLRSLWTARHAQQSGEPTWNLWKHLLASGVQCQLLTDSNEVASLAEQYDCPKVTLIEVVESAAPAESTEQCCLTQVFAAAIELLASEDAPDVLWIHARALRWPWDAPLELRAAMIDPEDPLPPADVQVPQIQLSDESDPDLIVGWGQVAAAQLAVLDEALDGLDAVLQAREDAEDWSFLFCSLGGISLGEHDFIGSTEGRGYSEEVGAAALIRIAHSIPIGTRRNELCQLPDLPVTLLAGIQLPIASAASIWGRNLIRHEPPMITTRWPSAMSWAWGTHAGHVWLRTPAWSLLSSGSDEHQLFVKPDDRWEVNDVASRSTEVLQELMKLWPDVRLATEKGQRDQLPQVPEQLASLIR